MSIIKVKNAKVYIDGNSLVGIAQEVELPNVKVKTSEHSGLGMIGTIEASDGQIEKMESKIVWSSIFKELAKYAANPNKTLSLQIRAKQVEYKTGECASVDAVYNLTCRSKGVALGSLKTGESLEGVESELSVDGAKVNIDGKDYLEVDVLSGTYKIEGKDVEI